VFVLNRHVERVFDPSGNENLGAAEAGAGSMREDGNDVRFDANSGLAPDSAPCPKSAKAEVTATKQSLAIAAN